MKKFFFLNPIFVFVATLLAVGLSLFFTIHWYVQYNHNLKFLIETLKLDPNKIAGPGPMTIVIVITLLVTAVIVGIAIIFTYYQKTQQLYKLQENFINNFTHELKTPIASIKLYLETFLKHDLSPSEQKEFIRYMLKDSQRLSSHVEQILMLAQIENRKRKYQFETVDLFLFIQHFLEENKHLFQKGTIILETPPFPTMLSINKELFEMAIMNILTNAFKYNRNVPHVVISFSWHKGTLKITFQDNGIGLDPSESKNIFKKFYQVGNREGFVKKGTGLGLHLTDQIIRLHKGRITARGLENGQGSEFIISLTYLGAFIGPWTSFKRANSPVMETT